LLVITKNPPVRYYKLSSLTAGDEFKIWPWWKRFNVKLTPVEKAMQITHHGKYSKASLELFYYFKFFCY
jgi:hypothetical protein